MKNSDKIASEMPRIIWTLFFMLLFYVKFAMRCVHGVVTLLRPTRGKLMPSYTGCIVMEMWVQSIILTTWDVLLMLNCFRRCVKCITALIIFCPKWKLLIIHCVKEITILNCTTVYLGTHLSFAVFFKFKWLFLVVNCCNVILSIFACTFVMLINIHTYIHAYIHTHIHTLYRKKCTQSI